MMLMRRQTYLWSKEFRVLVVVVVAAAAAAIN